MYQVLSEEGFTDGLIAKLVGSDFGQKIATACEMQQQLVEKMNTLAGNAQKVQQEIPKGSSSLTTATQENKNNNTKNEFDKLIQASLDRIKNYAQEQLKSVVAHKESLSQGLKNVFKNISSEASSLLTALLSKRTQEIFDGWQSKLSKSIKERLDKIFKTDKSKDDKQASSGDKKTSSTNSLKSNEKGDQQSNTQGTPDPNYEPSSAVNVFKKDMDKKETNYTKIMEDSFNRINSSAEQHFNKMLTGAESFSQGFKGIFKDMTTEISKMLLEIFYKQVIEKRLGKWFGDFLGKIFKAEGGPVASQTSYIVGERGPELFIPDHAGTIIPNHQLDETIATAKTQGVSGVNRVLTGSGTQAPPVVVNVVNKSGVQANTRQEAKWDGQQYIVNVVMDAYARNVNGMRDVLGVRR